MNGRVVFSIFKRNFKSYFASPIGYVFICAFVLLTGFAAFWPNEFFNANLANLNQLNAYLPWIMLVFIPAVTMSIWAQERERGTDELLLTLPATEQDVIAGKYLAGLAIFTVSLLFSTANILVLVYLGKPDIGLLIANYVGYWFVGAAMLAVGMVASFLTRNLTVAFILAVAFNAPLVFASYADVLHEQRLAQAIQSFSIEAQFADFARGLITASSVVFFCSLAAVMLYLSMVLIRRRHWAGTGAGAPMGVHFAVRTACVIAAAVGCTALANRFDGRIDATVERLSSLSPQTKDLLRNLPSEHPVFVEAFVSTTVPEQYVKTQIDLLSMLREFNVLGGDSVIVNVNDTERYSAEEQTAREQFGITARPVQSTSGGKLEVEEIFLGAAIMCGLDKVVIPFFDRGIPVEYELVRSITTVSQQQRKRIGIVSTDAQLFGGFDMQSMSSRPGQRIVSELNKQYETVRVNAAIDIADDLDALLVVQPSSLPQNQMNHVMEAIERGLPTALFEDPYPRLFPLTAPTSQPRVAPGGSNPFQQNRQPPPEPKGDITRLWNLLQVSFSGEQIVWDTYNPYPTIPNMPDEFVFVGAGSEADEPFNEQSAVTGGLQQTLLIFPGWIEPAPGGGRLAFNPLMTAGAQTGILRYGDLFTRDMLGRPTMIRNPPRQSTDLQYILAAHIHGPAPASATPATAPDTETDDSSTPAPADINVLLVADIDILHSEVFRLRERGFDPNDPVQIVLDNVTFVLNALDRLAGEDRFIDIRKRRPIHRTLERVEKRTAKARALAAEQRENFVEEFSQKQQEEQKKLEDDLAALQARQQDQQGQGVDIQQFLLEFQARQTLGNRRLQAIGEQLVTERDEAIERTERELTQEIRRVQFQNKLWVLAGPAPPLMVALVVYLIRARRENIGAPAARLKPV